MNKQQILQLTGLSEDQFYDQYPDQETFCNDYPEACAQLEQAQGGMQVGVTYDSSGNPVNISPDVTPSQWQTVDGMYTRPHTVDRFGNPIAPMTSVTRQPVDRVPFNRAQPMDVISPMIARYTLPKGMVDNSKPIEKMTIPVERMSPKQTMQQVGSIGKSYNSPINKYDSIVDLLKARGMDASFSSRKELAKQLGINNYIGSASQNMELLNMVGDNSDQMKYGGIHIKKANRGKFTEWAKAHHMGVQEAASHVMANKENYSPTIVKRANFAKNAAGWKHEEGGIVEYQNGGYVVKSGDTLSQIAAANKMSLGQLLSVNPQFRSNPDLIHIGDRVMLANRMGETPLQRSNREYAVIADNAIKANNAQRSIQYPVTITDAHSTGSNNSNVSTNQHPIIYKSDKVVEKNKSLPNKKQVNTNNEQRHLESGMIEDKNKGVMYVVKNGEIVKTFPIMTGLNKNANIGNNSLEYLERHPEARATPVGTYISKLNPDIYGHAGFNLNPISAFGEPAPSSNITAQHVVFGNGPKGTHGYNPTEYAKRMRIMRGPGENRVGSYGCTNMYGQDIDCLTGQLFPKGDTTIIVDSRRKKDAAFIKNIKQNIPQSTYPITSSDSYETGGTKVFPAMRNFQGGGGTTYSNFLNMVGNPEMIQSDTVRSEYIPESNTIYYDSPRSIPDELAHAYQKANGNMGYSIPPNQNTMMREIPKMQNVYFGGRGNLNPKSISDDAGFLNTIREKNVPNDSNNSLANTYIKRYFPGDEFAGDSYLNRINDANIYLVPGTGEFEAHQIFEPRIRNEFFDYRRSKYKKGGYYGMDQKFHPNSDSGTYVGGAGYYFQPGGTAVTSSTPPGQGAGVDVSNVPGAGGLNPDGSFAGDFGDESGFSNSSDPYSDQDQEFNDQQAPYDGSQYSSEIDPATGFTKYKKNDLVLKNIKKQDPALWAHLKEEGHGARWQTGQTDIQKFGRTAGAIGKGLGNAIDAAGMIGGYLNSRQQQRNMDKAAMNMGSTASMFTNPQGSGKGDYGVTGSGYGMFKPNQTSNFSFKGMYGEYGMEVPSYQIGGGFSNLFANAQTATPISSPMELMPNIPISNFPKISPSMIPVNNNRPSEPSSNKNDDTDNSDIKKIIAKKESNGNYTALPWKDKAHTKLASSAAGKYQFLWNQHKNDIKEVTGVKTKQEFLNNPDAQEEFFDYWNKTTLTPWANKIKSQLNVNLPINEIKAAIHFSGPKGAWNYFTKGKQTRDAFGSTTSSYIGSYKNGGQLGGQVVEMDENQIQQFLAAGGQLEFLD